MFISFELTRLFSSWNCLFLSNESIHIWALSSYVIRPLRWEKSDSQQPKNLVAWKWSCLCYLWLCIDKISISSLCWYFCKTERNFQLKKNKKRVQNPHIRIFYECKYRTIFSTVRLRSTAQWPEWILTCENVNIKRIFLLWRATHAIFAVNKLN